ncbi:MAG: SUF system NifU family Fe-S cluster assembly protein [Coriobacteriia bacterium]|nr:SUF system NifU family Fe-S cluster assembly protein [Coriobacteriia bacterium]
MDSIYQGALLDHSCNPTCRRVLANATHTHEGVNASCGDDVTLSLVLDESNVIQEAAFTGNGCAVSQASADIMASVISGKPLAEAVELADAFIAMIDGAEPTPEQKEALGEAAELQGVSRMPARAKCAQLGWRTLQEIAADLAASAV